MRGRAATSSLVISALLLAPACDLLRPEGKRKVELNDDNLAKIEAGWFVFGGKPYCRGDAVACAGWLDRAAKSSADRLLPWRLVYQTGFYIEKREVTNAEYLECVQDGRCDYPGDVGSGDANSCFVTVPILGDMLAGVTAVACRFTRSDLALEPIRSVTWKQAREYCRWRYDGTDWVQADLPTEAMWERAAVGLAEDGAPFEQPTLPGAVAAEPQIDCAKLIHGVADTECYKDPAAPKNDVYGQTAHPWSVATYDGGAPLRAEYGTAEGVRDLAGNVAEWVMDASDEMEGNYDCKSTAPPPPQTPQPIQDLLGADYAVASDCECVAGAGFASCADPGAHRRDRVPSGGQGIDYCNPFVGQDFASAIQDADENVEHVYKGGSYGSESWCQLNPRARLSGRAPLETVGFRCAVRTKAQADEAKACVTRAATSPLPGAAAAPCSATPGDGGVDAGGTADAGSGG